MPTSYYGGRVTHRKEEFPQHPARGRLLVSAERVILHGSWWRSGSLTVCPAISALRTIVDYVACSRNRWTQQTPHGVQGWFQQLAVLKGSLVPRRNRTLAVSCVHRTEEVSKREVWDEAIKKGDQFGLNSEFEIFQVSFECSFPIIQGCNNLVKVTYVPLFPNVSGGRDIDCIEQWV
ncbi:uncharacterized protein LOC125543849 isoform X2 [Triticum urartu]|uniref:uncharacterized protein LOC125543849 isoform X2 n=2 Tax=Triticum TaxID=4564 RepID=UPI00204438EB|nr:uncharacterized protein LOC125543849 isoform X2 [Triticum urartu]